MNPSSQQINQMKNNKNNLQYVKLRFKLLINKTAQI